MVILFVTEHKMQAMFPAQARDVAEAGLRPPPTSAEFMAALIAAQAPKPPPADVALFGTTYAKPAGNRPGTEHNHSVSCRAAIEFVKVCDHRKCELTNLDDWMVGFSKWVLHPQFLLPDEEDGQAA